MTTYSLDFINNTPDTWTMAVYQTLPDSPGLTSVSWKQTTVPTDGESGVRWDITYCAVLANYQQAGGKGVYKASQKRTTNLGQAWDCVWQDDVQQLIPDGSTAAGQVLVHNKSNQLADIGIGMDGDVALVQSDVYSGTDVIFTVNPTYWVALYKNVVKGEVISGGQAAGPLKVTFPSGITSLTYEAHVDGSTLVFQQVPNMQTARALLQAKHAPLQAVRVPLVEVNQKLARLNAL